MVCWKMYNFLRPPCICVSCQCFDSIGWLGIRKNIQLVESWLMLIADLRGAAFEPAWSRMDVARGLAVVSTHSSNSYSYWWGWRHCVVPVFCSSVHTCMCVHVSVCISACVQTVAFPDSVLLTSVLVLFNLSNLFQKLGGNPDDTRSYRKECCDLWTLLVTCFLSHLFNNAQNTKEKTINLNLF